MPQLRGNEPILGLNNEYLFPWRFFEMKGIAGSLRAIKIHLKLDAKPVKKMPHQSNPKYKEKVHKELDQMMNVGIIVPMVVQPKKIGDIQTYVDLRNIIITYIHDPFLTPFIDEVLENVGHQEAYSFTDNFSGYHHVCIAEEDQSKATFAMEWGSFAYTIIPFGLNNSLALFSRMVVASFKDSSIIFLKLTWTIGPCSVC
jgi:hypothetical protein